MLNLRTVLRAGMSVIAVSLGLVLVPAVVASAAPSTPHMHFRPHLPSGLHLPGPWGHFTGSTYDCSGGVIPPGVYGSLAVTGVCYMPAGNITVRGNVTVAPGALLDAVSKGDPAGSPVVPATVDIYGSVWVGAGADFLFGCSPNITCTNPPGITYDHIQGSLTATGAQGVVLHSATIGGNVTINGGGGGAAAEACAAQTPKAATPLPTIEPWSEDPYLDFIPVYTDAEDVTIGGSYTVTGLTSCWLGSLRDQIGGNATFAGNTLGDPDALEIDNNLVNRNMVCENNTHGGTPGVQFGDSGSAPNMVGGFGVGECGFNVTSPNPSTHTTTTVTPPVHITAGIAEHLTVSTRELRTSFGTYTSTTKATLPIATTEAGDQIVAELGTFSLSGFGLTGGGTYNPTLPPGHSGAALLDTSYPTGNGTFTLYLNCHCTYEGQTGTIQLRAYGTSTRSGFSTGTFFVTSGGAPVTVSGDLSTLAGYGTFFGGPTGTVHLVEHLAIT
jgi:hypothetical protein